MTRPLPRREVSIVSPLRYPGAKRRLSGYVSEILKLNGLRPEVYVEPFAGGASVALELANRDMVDKVILGERDPLVSSFWKVVFNDTEWLVEKVAKVKVSLRQWDRFRRQRVRSDRGRALACLFLNRTSFSGILASTAGPIGGRTQESDYEIDCRFSRQTLIRRIQQAASLKSRVLLVKGGDWRATVRRAQELAVDEKKTFFYFDPPFYNKADRLYNFCFEQSDHEGLRDFVLKLTSPWVLSYDAAGPIRKMYSRNGMTRVELLYSASPGNDLVKTKELIISNLEKLPKRTRLWQSMAEWKLPRRRSTSLKGGARK